MRRFIIPGVTCSVPMPFVVVFLLYLFSAKLVMYDSQPENLCELKVAL